MADATIEILKDRPLRVTGITQCRNSIHDNRSVCAHIGHCTGRSPEVFSMNKEPWIKPDGGEREKTVATITMCPPAR